MLQETETSNDNLHVKNYKCTTVRIHNMLSSLLCHQECRFGLVLHLSMNTRYVQYLATWSICTHIVCIYLSIVPIGLPKQISLNNLSSKQATNQSSKSTHLPTNKTQIYHSNQATSPLINSSIHNSDHFSNEACFSRCASPKPWRSWGSWRALSFLP